MHQERKPPKAGESIILAFIRGVSWVVKDVGQVVGLFEKEWRRFSLGVVDSLNGSTTGHWPVDFLALPAGPGRQNDRSPAHDYNRQKEKPPSNRIV